MSRRMGKSGPGFFVACFAVYNNGKLLFCDLLASVPDFLYKRTGCIVGFGLNPNRLQAFFHIQCRTERRDDNNIVGIQTVERYQRLARCILQKTYAFVQQILIHDRIMNHFTE